MASEEAGGHDTCCGLARDWPVVSRRPASLDSCEVNR
jgi:hypothetical protein